MGYISQVTEYMVQQTYFISYISIHYYAQRLDVLKQTIVASVVVSPCLV